MNKSTFASCTFGALSLLSLLGCAQPSLAARMVDVTVIDRNTGERLTTYRHDGKLYIAGTPGDAYAVELKSKRGERVLTVLSVDGINVLTGQTAATLQSGYVIDAGQRYGINGWRKSMDDVAQFVFTALPDSYAARTGRPGNVGVIGVAVYREKVAPPSPQPFVVAPQRAESLASAREEMSRATADSPLRQAAPVPSAKAESAAGNLGRADQAQSFVETEKKDWKLGTGHGGREYSPTSYTEFVRNSDSPDEIVTLYYDSRANLIARGIIPSARHTDPTPFPAGAGFVPDSRG